MGLYREEVIRGAAFLDERRPGWRDQINLDTLDLGMCTTCVLGQLAGGNETDWATVLDSFSIEYGEDEHEYGFNLYGEAEAWSALTEEWREYIRETRSAVAS